MKKYIKISTKEKEWIMQAFDVSLVMVNHALGFDKKRGNSDLAKRIRKLALHRGGVLMNELPVFETIHNTASGEMVQEFPNGAKLVAELATGTVKVYDKAGVIRHRVENCTIERLYIEQLFAAGL
jgi:hypothetical protein|nr:MAG TPA: hypothetical protein [Caudoviricetes sp.]DAN82220.1 MAG TPA: hypothetical protein [Caudoviricetes sp.]